VHGAARIGDQILVLHEIAVFLRQSRDALITVEPQLTAVSDFVQ